MNWQKLKENLPPSPRVIGQQKAPSAVLLPVLSFSGKDHILFQVRAEGIPQATEICFPGGRFDPSTDRSLEETAVRETCEELGIEEDQVKVQGELGILLSPFGFAVHAFVGQLKIKSLEELDPNPDEVADIFTLPLAALNQSLMDQYQVRMSIEARYSDAEGKEIILLPSEELGLPRGYHHSWGKRRKQIYHLSTQSGPLWGITAEILHDFLGLLD